MNNKANGMTIAGVVVSFVSILLLPLFGITGAVGAYLSHKGKEQAEAEGGPTKLATFGFYLGLIGAVEGVIRIFSALS